MADYYNILGVEKSASDEDIKKAYRRLSSAHHPDKHAGASDEEKAQHEAKFKEAKEAYEVLSDPKKRAAYDRGGQTGFQQAGWHHASPSEMDDILEQLRRARGGFGGAGFRGGFRQVTEFQTAATLKEAFEGFSVDMRMPDGTVKKINIPPGTPDGYRSQHEVTPTLTAIVVTRIHDPNFRVKSAADCSWHQSVINGQQQVVIETGDIETTIKVDAIDLLIGAWTSVVGFLGEELSVRIPAGFDPAQRLKVKGKGYYHWAHQSSQPAERGDLFIKVEPQFNTPRNLDRAKVEELYKQVEAFKTE